MSMGEREFSAVERLVAARLLVKVRDLMEAEAEKDRAKKAVDKLEYQLEGYRKIVQIIEEYGLSEDESLYTLIPVEEDEVDDAI